MSLGDFTDQNHPLYALNFRRVISIAAAPGANNDITQNFGPGSMWVDTSTTPNDIYVCVDNTDGAAVWKRMNRRYIVTHPLPLDADGVFHIPLVNACRVLKLTSAVSGATTTTAEDATIQAALGTAGDFTNVTNGLITIAGASAVGTVDTATPTALNEASAGDVLELTVTDGSQVAAATAIVTIEIAE